MATTQVPLPGTKSSEAEFEVQRMEKYAQDGTVFLTEEGVRTHVLLRSGRSLSIGELLSNPAAAEIEFDLPTREVEALRSLDFD